MEIAIVIAAGDLALEARGDGMTLLPRSGASDEFDVSGAPGTLRFARDDDGVVTGVDVLFGSETIRHERLPD